MLHLFHPALVHFSVAFIVTGAFCEAVGLLAGRDALRRWGEQLLVLGAISLIPTLVSGYLAANTVAIEASALALLGAHERNGWILLGLAGVSLFWKAWCGGRVPAGQRRLYAGLLAAVIVLAIYSAWLGGRMVYGEGVGVGIGVAGPEVGSVLAPSQQGAERVTGDLRVLA